MKRPVSQTQMFRAVLVLRWAALAMVPVQVLMSQAQDDRGIVLVAWSLAVAYMAAMTLNAENALAHLNRSLAFSAVDMAVTLGIYATGPLTNWLFFLFSVTSFLLLAVRGRVSEGVIGAVVWNVLATSIQGAWRLPPSQYLGVLAIEDLINLSVVGGMWAFACGTVLKLNETYDESLEAASALELANGRLDEREKIILGLLKAAEEIASERDLDVILSTLIGAMSGVGFGACRLWILDEGVLHPLYPVSEDAPDVPASGASPVARAIESREPVRVPAGADCMVGLASAKEKVAVPLLAGDEAMGVLVMAAVTDEGFDGYDVEVLELFAEQISLAIQHVRLQEQTRALAVAQERSRITREIHDTVLEKMVAAERIAASLRIRGADRETAERLAALRSAIGSSLQELRFAVLNWDSLEAGATLSETIERYAAEVSALTGMAVSVVLRGDDRDCRLMALEDLMRILQGTLSNVWHHAYARSVNVDLEWQGTGLAMMVRDDGRGFDLTEAAGADGLAKMRELARRNMGRFEIASAPGDGTVVRAWLQC